MKKEDLKKEMIDALEDSLEELMAAHDPIDLVHELIDGGIPIYNSDLAELLADDNNFASVDDEGLLPKNPTVWQIISTACYEYLCGISYQWMRENGVEQ